MTVAHSTLTGSELHESKGAAAATAGQVAVADGAGAAAFGTLVNGSYAVGAPVQVTGTVTTTSTTTTTVLPCDNSIPTSSEGAQFLSHAHTPKSATNKLLITVVLQATHTANTVITAALFQDSDAAAIAAAGVYHPGGDAPADSETITFQHIMTAGGTSAITFKVRAGGDGAGTLTFNGDAGTRNYGGVSASSIAVTEYKAS